MIAVSSNTSKYIYTSIDGGNSFTQNNINGVGISAFSAIGATPDGLTIFAGQTKGKDITVLR